MDAETEFRDLSSKLKTAVERTGTGLESRFAEIEQKLARRPGPGFSGGSAASKGFGDVLVDSPEFKALMGTASSKGVARVQMKRSEVKAINPAITSSGGGAGIVAPDNRFNDIIQIARQSLPIRALCEQDTTESNLLIYPRQATRTLNAAGVAEGTMKPQSDVTFTDVQVPIRTLAHFFRFSVQIMYDAPAFRGFLNDEAAFGLKLLEESQFLYGDGSSGNPASQNLFGMVPQAQPLTIPAGRATPGSDTALDRIAYGMEQVVGAALPCDGLILNPIDWIEIMRIKDSQGRYISGQPFSAEMIDKVWNLNISAFR